jgi:CheY-like chemotaxis protein
MNNINESTELDKTKQNILIVDDEPANTLLLKKILATRGYINVMTTLDPTEVIPLHLEHDFELILLDINMPKMNGYEVLEQLRNTDNFDYTQVVATSADISIRDPATRLNSGFSDYITKPMKIKVILEIVEKALQKNLRVN